MAEPFYIAVESALKVGDMDKARELMRIVESIPPGRIGPIPAGEAARFRALIAAATGQSESVEPEFKLAETRLREVTNPFRLAVILLEHGEWLAEQGRADEAEPLLAEAREIFERLRARPWLERLDNVGAPAMPEAPAADAARA
jgi:hypothetical protein